MNPIKISIVFIAVALFAPLASASGFVPFCTEACNSCKTCGINSTVVDKMAQIQEDLDEAKLIIAKMEAREGVCDVKSEDKCYSIVSLAYGISYDTGRQICAARGGVPANIYSEQQYSLLMEYMQTKIILTRNDTFPWTGMRFNSTSEITVLRNGTVAPFLKWITGYPSSDWRHTRITLVQNHKAHDVRFIGMRTQNGLDRDRNGVVCEY
ncbi:uncharacterized protein LOC120329691 [Styela clava]